MPWHTRINGDMYRLTEHGRLQKEEHVSTARLSTPDDPPEREAIIRRIIRAELDALAERLLRDVQKEDHE